jgi:hypothetical protein
MTMGLPTRRRARAAAVAATCVALVSLYGGAANL